MSVVRGVTGCNGNINQIISLLRDSIRLLQSLVQSLYQLRRVLACMI